MSQRNIQIKGKLDQQLRDFLTYLVDHVERYGFQPTWKEAARHFKLSERMIRNWVEALAIQGVLTVPPGRKERCVGINFVTFSAVKTEKDPIFPAEFLTIAGEQGTLHKEEKVE
jgi:hypothetical protein